MKQRKQMEINEKTSMFLLAGPIFVELLLNILLSNVDTVMLSNYSQNAVGAVGNANQMMFMFIILFNVIAGATGVVVAQYLGAKKTENMNQIYSLAVVFNLVLGILMSLAAYLLSGSLMRLLKVDVSQVGDAVTYMKIVGGFIFLQAGYNVMVQILRCHGYTRVGMYISLAVNVVNIIGNWLFLYGPLDFLNLGVAGVAISTVAARALALIVSLIIFYRLKIGKISLRALNPFPTQILVRMLKIGIPSAGENMAYSFYQLILLSFINPMGASAANAKVFSNTLMSFSVVFSNALAQATQIVTGHLVGAGREDAADKRVMKTLYTSLPVAIGIAALNCLICPITLRIFNCDAETLVLVRQVLLVGIVMEIGRTINLVVIGSMKAAGDVLFPVLVGLVCMWGIGIAVGYSCGVLFSLGVAGVFMGTAADECVRGAFALIRWRRGSWKGKAIVKTAKES
ncbi:MAG: MATE family efflux transporter [Lachnospiraceae bacterium]|nr:MATE family efflux transporter [Lachnospiraceae bacterium]